MSPSANFFFSGYVPIFLSEIWYYTKSKAIVVLKKKKKKEKNHKHKCGGAVISKILKAMLIYLDLETVFSI